MAGETRFEVRITVTPRADVLDPQGAAVQDALHALGFGGAGDVRVGRFVALALEGPPTLAAARAAVEQMCEKLIANPVVEDWAFEVTVAGEGT